MILPVEEGGDKSRGFTYRPDAISKQLVRFQQYLHHRHPHLDRLLDSSINGMSRGERVVATTLAWLEHPELPHLVLPMIGVLTVAGITNVANSRGRGPILRYGAVAGMSVVMGMLMFPRLQSWTGRAWEEKVVWRSARLQAGMQHLNSLHNHTVRGLVEVWDFYDAILNRFKFFKQQ